jgi:hypothetical protein
VECLAVFLQAARLSRLRNSTEETETMITASVERLERVETTRQVLRAAGSRFTIRSRSWLAAMLAGLFAARRKRRMLAVERVIRKGLAAHE